MSETETVIDATGMPQSAVVLGGSSDLALEVCKALAKRRLTRVLLAGRNEERLDDAARTLGEAGLAATTVIYDAIDISRIDALVESASDSLGEIDLVLVAVGRLDPESMGLPTATYVADQIGANFTGPAAAVAAFAAKLKAQGHGRIVVFSSAAAVRVRRSLLAYGSAKAGLDGFSQALADLLVGTGVEVSIVRPGYVHTKMTEGRAAMPLATGPEAVAAAVVRGMERNARVIWSPPILRALFALLVHAPPAIWRKASS